MAHRQHPIGSGFTAAATADDVLAGLDLNGKNVVITGGHSGLGLESARAWCGAGRRSRWPRAAPTGRVKACG